MNLNSIWRASADSSRSRRRGGMLVESALVIAFLLVPLILGLIVVGFNLIRAVQVNQINRDAGHMFARNVDFSSNASGQGNRAVIYQMAPRLKTTTSAGTAVLILSAIQYIGSNTCSSCGNLNHAVFKQQLVLGNPSLHASKFGTVSTSSLTSDGTGTVKDPLNDATVRTDGILAKLPMLDGDMAYVAETYYSSTDIDIPGFISPSGVYARAIF